MLTAIDLPFWNAFHDLGSERQNGMSLGSIPWSKAIAYAEYHEMDAEFFWLIIRQVDGEYLRMLAPKDPDDIKLIDKADMSDPKAVKRLLDGFNRRRQARVGRHTQ